MDWNRVEGNWKQFKGKAKEKWGKLTDDDLNVIDLAQLLQGFFGFASPAQDHEVVGVGPPRTARRQAAAALRFCQGSDPQGCGRLVRDAEVR